MSVLTSAVSNTNTLQGSENESQRNRRKQKPYSKLGFFTNSKKHLALYFLLTALTALFAGKLWSVLSTASLRETERTNAANVTTWILKRERHRSQLEKEAAKWSPENSRKKEEENEKISPIPAETAVSLDDDWEDDDVPEPVTPTVGKVTSRLTENEHQSGELDRLMAELDDLIRIASRVHMGGGRQSAELSSLTLRIEALELTLATFRSAEQSESFARSADRIRDMLQTVRTMVDMAEQQKKQEEENDKATDKIVSPSQEAHENQKRSTPEYWEAKYADLLASVTNCTSAEEASEALSKIPPEESYVSYMRSASFRQLLYDVVSVEGDALVVGHGTSLLSAQAAHALMVKSRDSDRKKPPHVTSIDLSPSAVALARKVFLESRSSFKSKDDKRALARRQRIMDFQEADVTNLNTSFAEGSFMSAVDKGTLDLFLSDSSSSSSSPGERLQASVASLHRVLSPNFGRLLVVSHDMSVQSPLRLLLFEIFGPDSCSVRTLTKDDSGLEGSMLPPQQMPKSALPPAAVAFVCVKGVQEAMKAAAASQ